MRAPFAEVIGDPIAQSKSPIIHKFWLQQLGIDADYRATQVQPTELEPFLADRRNNPDWLGCNVTIPHKVDVIPALDEISASAAQVGAVNCIERRRAGGLEKLVGHNTDLDGIEAALDTLDLAGKSAALIGAGGGARAVVAYLADRGAARISVVARDPGRSEALRSLAPSTTMKFVQIVDAEQAFEGAAAIINASPLGMVGAEPMPDMLVDAVGRHAAAATIFDLVTTPIETAFLVAGRAGGGLPVDGLTMLVGQAARAFELFFGARPPAPGKELRNLLIPKGNQ
ncbi:shikimate dehydrogenase [Sphingomonas daechungensis]